MGRWMLNKVVMVPWVLWLMLLTQPVSGQGRLVLDGAVVRLHGGISLVVANPDPGAITRVRGHIISEGAANSLRWSTGSGSYVVPWGSAQGEYIPFGFTLQGGEGAGGFTLSTYATGWRNNAAPPPGVPPLERGGEDMSAEMVDRFWRFEASGFAVLPQVSNLVFTYAASEATAAGNTIEESQLQAFRWNDALQTWSDYSPVGALDTYSRTFTTDAVEAGNLHRWWFLASNPASTPLPVELQFFRAAVSGHLVRLHWSTASERNNAFFVVERSLDAQRFEEVLRMAGKGNSSLPVEYHASDVPPEGGTIYYRLRQVDLDGTESLSPVVAVVLKDGGTESVKVFPNPSNTGKLFISLRPGQGFLSVRLYTVEGKAVPVQVTPREPLLLEVATGQGVRPGAYLLHIVGRQGTQVVKVLLR